MKSATNTAVQSALSISATVQEALTENRPVVALESTIISHGMPYPTNIETALSVEDIIRKNGAVPATIAIMEGKIRVGLSPAELEQLAHAHDVLKVSRRDLPYAVATGRTGATTVAATMICAQMAGISVFATGGIGGVHRGATQTMDVSADLMELAKTSVAVVCAGAKSILDIGLTLEYLETLGVPVVGYQTEAFPAFYSRDSGFSVNYRLNSAAEVARFLQTKWELGLAGGAVIANPIPEVHAMARNEIDKAITAALQDAQAQEIRGKDVTPFLLDKVKNLTDGKSLDANVALIRNNARVAADIACALKTID